MSADGSWRVGGSWGGSVPVYVCEFTLQLVVTSEPTEKSNPVLWKVQDRPYHGSRKEFLFDLDIVSKPQKHAVCRAIFQQSTGVILCTYCIECV